MPVAKNQIGELVDILEQYLPKRQIVTLLDQLSVTRAAVQNQSFGTSIDRMLVEARNRMILEQKS